MPEVSPQRYLVMMSWDDAVHLDEKAKADLWASVPAHQRAARSKGIPTLGSGMIFPIEEEKYVIDPIPIPDHWAQLGCMDFGWDHPYAACRLAWDRDNDCIYVIRDYRERETTPAAARVALSAWDLDWLPWAWPHDGLNTEKGSGEKLKSLYAEQGFKMLSERAEFDEGGNSVEAGLLEILERMQTGRWKVFKTCTLWLEEARIYHRKDGRIVKVRDDTISASRYGMMDIRHAITRPREHRRKRPAGNWRTA